MEEAACSHRRCLSSLLAVRCDRASPERSGSRGCRSQPICRGSIADWGKGGPQKATAGSMLCSLLSCLMPSSLSGSLSPSLLPLPAPPISYRSSRLLLLLSPPTHDVMQPASPIATVSPITPITPITSSHPLHHPPAVPGSLTGTWRWMLRHLATVVVCRIPPPQPPTVFPTGQTEDKHLPTS